MLTPRMHPSIHPSSVVRHLAPSHCAQMQRAKRLTNTQKALFESAKASIMSGENTSADPESVSDAKEVEKQEGKKFMFPTKPTMMKKSSRGNPKGKGPHNRANRLKINASEPLSEGQQRLVKRLTSPPNYIPTYMRRDAAGNQSDANQSSSAFTFSNYQTSNNQSNHFRLSEGEISLLLLSTTLNPATLAEIEISSNSSYHTHAVLLR